MQENKGHVSMLACQSSQRKDIYSRFERSGKDFVIWNLPKNFKISFAEEVTAGRHSWSFTAFTSVLQSAPFPQRSRDQLLQQGMTGPCSCLRHPGSETPNNANTPSAFNVFNERISYCDWKQNVPDSQHVGLAGRQKAGTTNMTCQSENSPLLFPPSRKVQA